MEPIYMQLIAYAVVVLAVGVCFGTLYITDANSYIINLPAGAWVWAYNGYITSFTEAPYNLISVASSAAYLRVLLVAMFYIPFFVAWNANRMNKPAIT